ncbi:flagellar filament capping protein FliD [Lachnotalea glycerini]|nr:flagellar filament capping protein FliD [Lachnotalea glycerini]
MLYNFYNYYLNTIMPKTASRYDTHNKSELKNVYSTIVKLNKESPLYMINMSDDLQNDVIDIKEHARELKNVITSISENEDNNTSKMFNDKIVTSSNEDIISVNYIGTSEDIDHAPSFNIEVEELASHQINKGRFIYSDNSNLSSDTYSFNVNIVNTNYEFQFIVKDNEKNSEILNKVSNMINRADIGIYSSLETDSTKEKQRIVLTSTATGTANFNDIIFRISESDTNHSKGSVQYMGLDLIAQKPSDSYFTINGIARSSSSNTFTVNKLYELSLHSTTPPGESVNISFKNDNKSIYHKISDFVDSYNNMICLANDTSSSVKKSSKLLADIGSIAQCYKSELESMGIMVKDDSSLKIDESLLTQTIDMEEADSGTFASFRSFRNPLNMKITNVLLNPMDYISKVVVTYPNTSNMQSNVYVTSMYSGLMFNNYC